MASQTLYEGQRVKREVSYTQIKDRNTGAFHHDAVTFKTWRKSKTQPWKLDPAASVTLAENNQGELSKALEWIQQHRPLALQLPTHTAASEAPAAGDARLQRYNQAWQSLKQLLTSHETATEAYLELFRLHPWLYGSEFSVLEPEAEALQVLLLEQGILRRSPDNLLELIWLDSPHSPAARLFIAANPDQKPYHEPYLSPMLAQLLAQVQSTQKSLSQYFAQQSLDEWHTAPLIKVKLICGLTHRDAVQIQALRLLNEQLKSIEIWTFDQVLYYGKKALSYLRQQT